MFEREGESFDKIFVHSNMVVYVDNVSQLRSKWNNLFRYEHASGSNQRENNVTKSFLKVLQDADEGASRSVISSVIQGVDQSDFEVTGFSTQIGLQSLQESEIDREFMLIGVSRYDGSSAMKTANEMVDGEVPTQGSGVVDAAITIELENSRRTIVFEIKTQSEPLDADQLARYQSQLGVPSERCDTLTWAEVYNVFRTEVAELNPDTNPRSMYLYDEFCEFLAVEELEGVVAQKDEGATKRILVRRKHNVADSEAERYGDLELRIQWADKGSNSSSVGWIAAETFHELVRDMDDGLREAFRKADGSRLHDYLAQDDVDWPPGDGSLTYLAEANPRNDDHEDAILRLVLAEEGGRPQLRIARYVGTTYDRYTTPPYLTLGENRDEFTLLLSDLPANTREAVFSRQPDIEQLWQAFLTEGESRR